MRVRVRVAKNKLRQRLKALAPSLFDEMAAVNRKQAELMQQLARAAVPKRTGLLAESIVVTGPGQTPPAHSQGHGGAAVPDGGAMVTAGNTAVRYAHLIEHDTDPHVVGGIMKGATHPGTKARPYFWPSYRIARFGHKKETQKAVRRAVKKVKAL